MISLGDALLKIGIDKSEFEQGLQEVENRAKQTQQTFRALERVTRPLGVALVGLGAAGLMAAKATEDWNNAIGRTLQGLKPFFAGLTAVGGILLTLPPMIRGVKVALDLLKLAMASTLGVFGIAALAVGTLAAALLSLGMSGRDFSQSVDGWNESLSTAKDRLKALEDSGEGASEQAGELRNEIDLLTDATERFTDLNKTNEVSENNLNQALEKRAGLIEDNIRLVKERDDLEKQATDRMKSFTDQMISVLSFNQIDDVNERLENTIALLADNSKGVLELDASIEAVLADMTIDELAEVYRTASDELKVLIEQQLELNTEVADMGKVYQDARDDAVDALEELYGFRADETKSLLEMYNDEVDARQDSLNDQLDAVRKSTNDVIKQYRREYDARVKLLDDETDAQVEALERQLGILDDSQEAADDSAEDEADAKTETELRLAVSQAWNRKDRATAEANLAKFLEDKAKKLADRQREYARQSLQKQIDDVQSAADQKRAEYQQELDAKTEVENAKLEASEITIQSELNSLQNAANIKRGILQQEFNDAVAVQNRIRDNAIAAINTVIAAQLYAATNSSVPLTAQGAIDMQSGIDYENWAAASGGGIRRYANGGPVLEDSLLVGMRSGKPYAMAHAGETVTPKGTGGITITGNTFNVRSDADIPRIASELLRQRMLKGSFGS